MGVKRGGLGHCVGRMVHSPPMRRVVADKGSHETREDGVIADATDGEDLEAEDRSRERCSKDRPEPGTDPSH